MSNAINRKGIHLISYIYLYDELKRVLPSLLTKTHRYSSLVLLRKEETRMDDVLDCSQVENDQGWTHTQAGMATLLGFCEGRWWIHQLWYLLGPCSHLNTAITTNNNYRCYIKHLDWHFHQKHQEAVDKFGCDKKQPRNVYIILPK